jgi:4-aminobutyrate aminotransferase-like enzyme
MMIVVELLDADGGPDAALCKRVLAGCRERGLLLLNCGSYDNVVRFIPPLVADEQQVRQAARIFEEALAS